MKRSWVGLALTVAVVVVFLWMFAGPTIDRSPGSGLVPGRPSGAVGLWCEQHIDAVGEAADVLFSPDWSMAAGGEMYQRACALAYESAQ